MKQHWYILGIIAVFVSVEIADKLEMTNPGLGSVYWYIIMGASVVLAYLRLKRIGWNPVLAVLGLIPYFGLIFLLVLAFIPDSEALSRLRGISKKKSPVKVAGKARKKE